VLGRVNGLSADSIYSRGPEDGTQGAVACLEAKLIHEEPLISEIGTVSQNNSFHWYAIRVRSQNEDLVARHLRVRGLESFLPVHKQQHRWSDRFKEIELPLFPGYVFCQFDPLNRLPVLTVPGVVHVVGTGKTPVPIDEDEIAAIQAAVKSGFSTQPWPFVEIGQRVRIEYGPLCGIEGLLLGFRGHHRIVLSITLLQRSVTVEINGEWARPLSPMHGASNKLPLSERFHSRSIQSHA
jgi:transcription antitermination factor NusG